MKKYNVFKILSISILLTILLSFLIPATTMDYYGGSTTGSINPVSIIDTLYSSMTSFGVFLNAFIYILCVGVFYGVLVKTGKYDSVINNTAYKFRNKKGLFVVISTLILGIMTVVTGNIFAMVLFVPAFIGVYKKLGYDKITSVFAVIASILLGNAGSFNTVYSNQILNATVTDNIIVKILISLILLVSLIVFVLVFKKPENVELKKIENSKSLHISIILDIILVLIIIGMVPWNTYFGFEGFNDFHNTLLEGKVLGVSIFKSLVSGNTVALGEWTFFELSVIALVASVIIALINKIKVSELIETVAKSIRKSLAYAFIVVLANIVLVNVYTSGFFYTLITNIAKMGDKVFAGTLLSALASFVYPDYMYASQFTLSTATTVLTNQKFLVLLAVIFQAVYSLFLLVSPTSILMLLGLQYSGVSYKEWFKYVCKYFLVTFIISFVIIMIVARKFVSVFSIVLLVVLIILLVLMIVLCKKDKKSSKKQVKTETKKEEKKEVKKTETKKQTSKKAATKKTSKK